MVDSIKPTTPTVPIRRDQNAQAVESHGDEKQNQQPVPNRPTKERRKNPDRRKNEGEMPRAIYEMRSGKDRRKGEGNSPSIEIDV